MSDFRCQRGLVKPGWFPWLMGLAIWWVFSGWSALALDSLINLRNQADIEGHRPLLIAHRGGVIRPDAPECSQKAIRLASELGYAMVELDVQRSKDGIPVVFHDRNLEHACGVSGRVDQYSGKELGSFTYKNTEERIVSLRAALAVCQAHQLGVMLDLKAGRDDERFLARIKALITEYGLDKSTVCISGTAQARGVLSEVLFTPTEQAKKKVLNGETVNLEGTFWFGLPNQLTSLEVALFQQNGCLVLPAINTFRYPENNHFELAKKDIERLMAAGVDGFQIDSIYSPLFEELVPSRP